MRRMGGWAAGAALLLACARGALASSCAPPLHPIVAEILYDATGDDTGREFVEFFNPHPVALSLSGVKLEVGDGSGPGRWTTRWTGGPADSVSAGGRFVVGGALVEAAPKALVTLDLQNGPDAVRVAWPDGSFEVVGYGALEYAEYACGTPAADVASGQSLARLPDEADLGSNAADFHAAAPSPGRANQRRRDAALLAGGSRVAPELPSPGAPSRLWAVLENRGLDPIGVEVVVTARRAGDPAVLASAAPALALAAAETASVTLDLPPLPAGKHRLRVSVALEGDEAPENDSDSLWVRVGQGPLRLTEIQFHPATSEGEWVEVLNADSAPLDLASYGFADRGGTPGHAAVAGALAAESLAVLAQNRSALLARFPGLDSARVLQVSPWPSLNNSDDPSGIADIALLIEADGTPSDRYAYSAAGVPAGLTLERGSDGVWGPAQRSGGTPLEPPRPAASLAGRFEVEPRRLAIGGRAARLRWDLPWPRARVAFELYDLAGRPRGAVLPETPTAGRGERLWVPRDVPPGLYLLVLRARAEGIESSLTEARAVRVEAP